MGVDGTGIGGNASFGIIPATTWHTAQALSGNAAVKVKEVAPVGAQRKILTDEAIGQFFAEHSRLGKEIIDLTFSGDLRYEGAFWHHIVQLIGTDVGSVATGVYTHTVTMSDIVSGRFYTAVQQILSTRAQLYEYPSVKPMGFKITTDKGSGLMQFECTGIADTCKIGGDATNDSDNMPGGSPGIDYSSNVLRVPFCDARVNINAKSGAAFDSGGDGSDRVFPNAISIEMSRPYVRDFQADRTTTNSQCWQTAEPRHDGLQSDIIVTLEFDEQDSRTWFENFQDATEQKCEILFRQDADNLIKFEFPKLFYLQPDYSIPGPGRIPSVFPFLAQKAQTDPAGMLNITQPFKLTVINGDSNEYHDNSAIT